MKCRPSLRACRRGWRFSFHVAAPPPQVNQATTIRCSSDGLERRRRPSSGDLDLSWNSTSNSCNESQPITPVPRLRGRPRSSSRNHVNPHFARRVPSRVIRLDAQRGKVGAEELANATQVALLALADREGPSAVGLVFRQPLVPAAVLVG